MIRKTPIALVLIGASLAFVATACGGDSSSSGETTTTEATTTTVAGSASETLEGEVGPGFDIEVKQNGEDAESVKAGTYTLKVEDKSAAHNFHLMGPGLDKEVTDVAFVGDKSVTVTLEPG